MLVAIHNKWVLQHIGFFVFKFINAVHFTNKGGIVLIMDYITFSIGGLLVWATQWEVTSSPFPKPSPLV